MLQILLCFIIFWAVYKLFFKKESSSTTSAQTTPGRYTKHTHICPHCGELNAKFDYQPPQSWRCTNCACVYEAGGIISAASANEHAIINAWSGLDAFINALMRVTHKDGFITLDNGIAYYCYGLEKDFLATYPTEGITITGELHLMYLCKQRFEKAWVGTRTFWLMDHGLAWEEKK